MKKEIEKFRRKIKQDVDLGSEVRAMLLTFLDSLDVKINNELDGSISMIKHPLSEKVDWYFTYDEMKTIPIQSPVGMQDRDEVSMTLLLSKSDEE